MHLPVRPDVLALAVRNDVEAFPESLLDACTCGSRYVSCLTVLRSYCSMRRWCSSYATSESLLPDSAVHRRNTGEPPISPRRRVPLSHPATRSATVSSGWLRFPFNAHSHTVRTRHPSASSRSMSLLSRALLAANFSAQNSLRVDGIVEYLHPWTCQKQPCTKSTAWNRGKTRSGEPGSLRSCTRYRRPSRCNALRSRISGPVSRCRTDAMIRERTVLSTVSIQTLSTIPVVTNASRWRSRLSGREPPLISTPSSMFRSMAAALKLALVMKARAPSATAHFA